MYTKFWPKNLKERDHSKDLGVYGRIIIYFKDIIREGVDWIHLA